MDDIVDINTLFGPLPAASTDLTVDALIALMQKYNIGTACSLSTLGLLLDSAVGNSATRGACSEYSELLPVATLNPKMYFGDTDAPLALKNEGFCIVRFFPAWQGWPIDFAPFRAILQCLDEVRLPIMVSMMNPGEITALRQALDTYPAPVILSAVTVNLLAEALVALRQADNWYLETSRLLAPGAIKLVADTVGPERLLFGTGAPSQPVASVLNTLQYAGVSEDARRLILAGNARRILKSEG